MRAILQRVSQASVTIDQQIKSQIDNGLLVFIGIEETDNQRDVEWMVKKIVQMRIFSDDAGKMNLSVQETAGDILVVSQFTLYASTKKGNRPSFIRSAKPEIAIPIYEQFIQEMQHQMQKTIKTGTFGADMKVQIFNDGPVTIILDSKQTE